MPQIGVSLPADGLEPWGDELRSLLATIIDAVNDHTALVEGNGRLGPGRVSLYLVTGTQPDEADGVQIGDLGIRLT